MCLRIDVGKAVICRPIGNAKACVALVGAAVEAIREACPELSIWARYCSVALAEELTSCGWYVRREGWSRTTPLDDERFPQIILPVPALSAAVGPIYRNVRQIRRTHAKGWRMSVDRAPRNDVAQFANAHPPLSVASDAENRAFADSTFEFIQRYGPSGLQFYHLLSIAGVLGGIAITTVPHPTRRIVDGLFFACRNERRFVPYFIVAIVDELATRQVSLFNLGGSEKAELHRFKAGNFGPCRELRTVALCGDREPGNSA